MTTQFSELPNLNFGLTVKPLHCVIHPPVTPNVLDHFLRKPEDQGSLVAGALLGTIDGTRIDIMSSFAVPQYYEKTSKELVVDTDYMQKMLKFYRKANPNEGLLGLYISCKKLDEHGNEIVQYFNELFREEKKKALLPFPLIMLVDPTLSGNKLQVKVSSYCS